MRAHACVDVARGALLRNRAEPSARAFYSAAVSAGKSSHVSFTRIRNVSHKYTSRAHTRAFTDAMGAKFFPRTEPRPRDPPLYPSILRARFSPKTAIPHLSLHLLDLQRLKRKLVRSHPDLLGRDVRALLFCSPRRLCLPRHRAR